MTEEYIPRYFLIATWLSEKTEPIRIIDIAMMFSISVKQVYDDLCRIRERGGIFEMLGGINIAIEMKYIKLELLPTCSSRRIKRENDPSKIHPAWGQLLKARKPYLWNMDG